MIYFAVPTGQARLLTGHTYLNTPPSMPQETDSDVDNDKDTATSMEEMMQSMDRLDQMLNSKVDKERLERLKELDKKHCEFYFRTIKKTKGPQPTPQETLEYRQSIPIRLRAIGPAMNRLFLAECLGENEEFDSCWGMLETAYADINTFQFAWIGFVMKEIGYMDRALRVLRILLIYASALLTNQKYVNPRKALKVLHVSDRAVEQLLQTMKQETGDEIWDLSYQEYRQRLYCCVAFAALGHKDDSMTMLRLAASHEQGHRLQAQTEYKHRDQHDKETIEHFESTVSILQLISEDLSVPRRHLDLSYVLDLGDDDEIGSALDKADDEDLWQCIQHFKHVGWMTSPVEFCEKCWATAPTTKLKKCSRCKDVSYCCRECQLNDWKEHKEVCNPKEQPTPTAKIKTKTEVIPE